MYDGMPSSEFRKRMCLSSVVGMCVHIGKLLLSSKGCFLGMHVQPDSASGAL